MNPTKIREKVSGVLKGVGAWPGWALLSAAVRAVFRRRGRVPVMLQLSSGESGAACLAMLLNYFGRQTRIAECREKIGTGRDGVHVGDIAALARTYGLRSKALRMGAPDFRGFQFPVIARLDSNHFVIVERQTPKQLKVIDPEVGRRTMPLKEFADCFSGEALVLEPGISFERGKGTNLRSWRYYLDYIWRHYVAYVLETRKVMAQILGLWLIMQALGLALPIFTKILIDQVLPLRMAGLMTILGIGTLLVVVTQLVTGYLRTSLLIYIQTRIDMFMMPGFLAHLSSLPLRFFQQRTNGDLLMRGGIVMRIRELLTFHLLMVVTFGGLVIGYLTFLLVSSPYYGLLVLGLGMTQVTLVLLTTRRIYDLTQSEIAAQTETQSYLVEMLAGIETLKVSGAEDRALDGWSSRFFRQVGVSLRRGHIVALIDTMMTALQSFSPLLLLWVGAQQVLEGRMTLGTMLAQNAVATMSLAWLAMVVSSARTLQQLPASIDRLIDVLDEEPEQNLTEVREAPPLAGHVELKNVSFRYDINSPWVLRDVSLEVRPGQKVAVVGRTGSGKSTLLKIFLGVHRQTEGEVLYDGSPLHEVSHRSLRAQCGVVLQEAFLFKDTIAQNVAFNDPHVTPEEVIRAARLACIHDDIAQMPMGYETPVVEGGGGLSSGQRQRVTLARALVNRPKILFLDEATSHLDTATEQLVDQNLSGMACTRIVIAHRLSTIRNADLILVLDEGRIVERGTHEELLAKGGFYATLVQCQTEGELAPQAEPLLS